MSENLLLITSAAILLVTMAFLVIRLGMLSTLVRELLGQQARLMEDKHREMLKDLHEGLANQGNRLSEALGKNSDQLRATVEARLDQISGHVAERLDEGFRKTNETFTSVMTRLATIDEAQKKIDSLTTDMVSLQELLGDKRSRGAFGEVQLEALVRNILPPTAYTMQHTLSNGSRVDCVLRLPPPTGMVAVDSKFPLENFHRMFDRHADETSRTLAQKQFKADVKKHVDDIAGRYILPPETCDGAVMFVPAEAVFAEIHAYHYDVVDYAMQKQVWIVSPTTLMAVLDGKGYDRDPRSLAKRGEAYLKSTGIGDTAFFGPEPEFFIFDSVTWHADMSGCSVKIESEEAAWSSGKKYEGGNIGHRPGIKGGYFPVPPIDSLHDIRSAMCLALEEMGIEVEVHHHEVATAGQCEIGTRYNSLVKRADWTQVFKYVVHNIAHSYGKTATFMPKPIVGDNGSGMHVHQSIWKTGQNLFSGNGYAGLSEMAMYYIGGVIRHAKALNAITNPGTNSYKRLVPGFEAPINLAYSVSNRSAAVRIPYANSPKGRRIEVRFPDPTANPYLAFTALLMAGLDGIQNKIHPGDPMDKNLYDLPPEEAARIPNPCASLDEALENLDKDRNFLTRGGVFSNDMIDAYIELKMEEVNRFRMTTHPVEFDMYYSL